MAGVALGQLGLDEGGAGPGRDLLGEAAAQLGVQLLFPVQEARLEQAGADRHVAPGLPDALVHRAHGMADLQPQVPQHVEHVLEHLFDPRRPLVGQHEQQVHVRERRHLAPPVAADRHDREMLARGRVGDGEDDAGRMLGQRPDHLVHQVGVLAHAVGAGPPRLQPPPHLGAPVVQRLAQGRQRVRAQRGARTVLFRQGLELGDQAPLGDDGPAIGDGVGKGQHVDSTHSRSGRHRPTGSLRRDHTLSIRYMDHTVKILTPAGSAGVPFGTGRHPDAAFAVATFALRFEFQ